MLGCRLMTNTIDSEFFRYLKWLIVDNLTLPNRTEINQKTYLWAIRAHCFVNFVLLLSICPSAPTGPCMVHVENPHPRNLFSASRVNTHYRQVNEKVVLTVWPDIQVLFVLVVIRSYFWFAIQIFIWWHWRSGNMWIEGSRTWYRLKLNFYDHDTCCTGLYYCNRVDWVNDWKK